MDEPMGSTTEFQEKPRKWYHKLIPLRRSDAHKVLEEHTVSGEHTAGFLSKLTFQWMTPLITRGYKRRLEQDDIWVVNPDRAVEPLTDKVTEVFQLRVRNGQSHPLLWALYASFRFDFWLGAICSLLGTIMRVTSPFVLRFLIQFATKAYKANHNGGSPPPISHGIGLVIGLTAMQVGQSLCINHFLYRGMLMGGQSRGVLMSMIYEKSMTISGRAKAGGAREMLVLENGVEKNEKAEGKEKVEEEKNGEKKTRKDGKKAMQNDDTGWENGRIINLMSIHTSRIDKALGQFHMIWTSPFACLITMAFLLANLAYAALPGLGLLMLGLPALTKAIRILVNRRKGINKITDQRISLTQEVLQSIRTVKYFGWEEAFTSRLGELRSKEVHATQTSLITRNVITTVTTSLPIFASMLSFITYSLSKHSLDPAKAFSALALFNGLRQPLNLFPVILNQSTDAWLSLKRIEEFLMAEEQREDVIREADSENAIQLCDASFTWEKASTEDAKSGNKMATKHRKAAAAKVPPQLGSLENASASTLAEEPMPFQLRDLSFKAGRGELVAIIGTVGSGKSSLLAALAGEMRKTGGNVVVSGASRALCPQSAWIQNTTLQNNITFGKEMDRQRYDEIIDACSLQADFETFPSGDQTEIGERGITISGGQKQRINIARAIYFDADIVFMDDPLSAVDAQVGRHIFDNAILGLLKDKCRIIATHQLWILGRCDRIIWMEGGRINAVDTFDNLMRDDTGFQKLMQTTTQEGKPPKSKEIQPGPEGRGKQKQKDLKRGNLMRAEENTGSTVPWRIYSAYIRASGSILNGPLVLFALILFQGANMMTSLWLSYWISNKFHLSTGQYIGIYAGLGSLQAVLLFLFSMAVSMPGMKASGAMLQSAISRVIHAPMSFFDTTPLGRILNRVSRDVEVMDNRLVNALRIYCFTVASVNAMFALIIAFFHYFAIALVPLFVIYIGAMMYYRKSAREVNRLESLLRSHVFAKFSEGLGGVGPIRAYGVKQRFINDLRASIDNMNGAYYLTFSNQGWLSMRLDLISTSLILTMGLLVVTSRFAVHPSIGGLVLNFVLAIGQMLQLATRQLDDLETGMNAVQRLHYYSTELEEEAPLCPKIEARLSLHIRGGERIGIIGRTGAGKSSIITALFRLVELSTGSISIDGLDISSLRLHDVRSRLAIIPQDPVLFRGTVRSNLDPFNEHTDMELLSALGLAGLTPEDESTDNDSKNEQPSQIYLDSIVKEDGLNFSLGQRQLMALARALVRDSRIVVCDEATSSVDMETDQKIQRTMEKHFSGKTVLCIAHRLRTILGYDRICVIDAGQIAELDTPLALWHHGGTFKDMCDRSGITVDDIQTAMIKEM
ncbi:ABC-type transporter cicA [Cladobotryum mycophilum]|uniref:ABC-type transporter cicA n=1 Tax=Cladobotryum mycophilum TaxID=491253 RepID=A0ABR0SV08_9HYPO